MNSRERSILISTCFGHFICHFNMFFFTALVLPLALRLNMDMANVLGMSFWMYFLFGITALPWGMAADRWNAKFLLILFYFGSGLSALAAAIWIESSTGFFVSLALLGLFSGIYHPAGLGLISKEIKRVGLGMGYNGMFGNLGIAMSPLLAGIFNWLWGLRVAYLIMGIMNIIGVALIFVFPLFESQNPKEAVSGEENRLTRAFLILLVAMMLAGIIYRGSTIILPAYFELKNQEIFQWFSSLLGKGLSKNLVATSVVSFIYLIGMLGQYTGGHLAERFDPKFCYLVFISVIVPITFLMGIARDLPLVFLAMVYFFFLLGIQPFENTLVAQFTPKKFHHSAYGTKFVLTFGIGALSVKMVEAIETTLGIEPVFAALGVISLVLVGVIIMLVRKTRSIEPSSS